MKATIQESTDIQYIIQVEIPSDVVDQKLQEVYRRVVRTLEIPGFRRGHVPRSFLESRFGKDFLYEDSQAELIEEYLPKALSELNIKPASTPEPKVVEFAEGRPFRFDVSVEIFPEVQLGDYDGIEVEAPAQPRVTQEAIDHALEELRLQHAAVIPRPRGVTVEAEDMVIVRQKDGQTREWQARKEGWTAVFLDKKVGESVELEAQEGQRLKVTIDAIKRIELPDLEELAQTLGHENSEALRQELREKLKESFQRDHEQKLRLAVLDAVVAKTHVAVPPRLVEEILRQELEPLKQSGQEPSAETQSKLKEVIEKRLKRERVLQTIKEREKIALSDEEFEEFLKQEAERRGTNPVRLKALLEREGQLDRLRRDRENQQALEFLMKKARIFKKTEKARESEEEE